MSDYEGVLPMKKLLMSLSMILLILAGCSMPSAKAGGYAPITLCENISFPISTSDILDTAQLGGSLYILGNGEVYSLSLESGESSRIFDSDGIYINAYDGLLHLFEPEAGCFRAYTADGELESELYLDDYKKPEPSSFKGFAVGDDCYIFVSDNESGGMTYIIADRDTGEVKTLSAPKNIRRICSYKDNSFLAICYGVTAADCTVWELDTDTEKSTKLGDINDMYLLFDLVYNPHTNSLLMTACGSDMQIFISEFTIDSLENTVISKPKLQATGLTNCNLSVSENIVSFISDLNDDYFCYDYENPTPYITLAYFGVQNSLTDFISEYESRNNVMVKIIHYDKEQVQNLNIKLMAGDSDIDCFCTYSLRKFAYITNYQFTDLYQFEDLKERVGANPFIEQISTFEDSCFGIPFLLNYYPAGSTPYDYVEENMVDYLEETRLDGSYFYLRAEQLKRYLRENIDLESKTYSDPDGEEFYSVLKQAYENSKTVDKTEKYRDIPYIYNDKPYAESEYLVMNPTSEKKELTANFLAEFFDYITELEAKSRPENNERVEGLLIEWKYEDYTTSESLHETFNSVFETDGSDETLRKFAREAAAEVAMRIGE